MTKQKEITEGIERILADSKGLSYSNVVYNILEYLQSKGVVIRTGYNQIVVDSPCTIVDIPKCESLIEEKPKDEK